MLPLGCETGGCVLSAQDEVRTPISKQELGKQQKGPDTQEPVQVADIASRCLGRAIQCSSAQGCRDGVWGEACGDATNLICLSRRKLRPKAGS